MSTVGYPIQVDSGAAQALQKPEAASRPRPHRYVARQVGKGPVERRSNQRFELSLEFDLFLLRGAKRLAWYAAGTTVDWSRNSILLRCGRTLAAGSSAQLVVRWTPGVQLIVVGRVIRADERGMVLRIQRRRFRGRPVLSVSPVPAVSWSSMDWPN